MNNMSSANEYQVPAPGDVLVNIPIDLDTDSDVYVNLGSQADIRRYFQDNGYVVCRGLIPSGLCDGARTAFNAEVRPYEGYIYRQASANPEKHVFTDAGHMLNSILNVQDLNSRKFPKFREAGLSILTHRNLQAAVKTLLDEEGKLVQSMYFEGNPSTWAHQDTYYLDSQEIGRMVAAWIAVEDIKPGAGRFYVYVGSHKLDLVQNRGDFNVAFQHDRYKQLVLDIIRDHDLECRAPALRKGDVLFWSSKTIHGSFKTTQPEYSRSSFTGHFIPRSTSFLQWQSREKPLKLTTVNSMQVHCPKNMDKATNKAVLYLETRFAKPFRFLKKAATRWVTR